MNRNPGIWLKNRDLGQFKWALGWLIWLKLKQAKWQCFEDRSFYSSGFIISHQATFSAVLLLPNKVHNRL